MEEKFLEALSKARLEAEKLGVRIRPVATMKDACRILSGHRASDGFNLLAFFFFFFFFSEAISTKKQFTALFTDDQANNALNRLLEFGYFG